MARIDARAEIDHMAALYGAEPPARVPPQSGQAEAAVLGGLMLSARALPIVQDILSPEDFYQSNHQAIYRAILALADLRRPFDSVTMAEWAMENGSQIDPAYLIELANTTPSAANVKAYAQIVADKALLRRMIDAGTAIVGDGYAPDGRDTADLLADAQSAIVALQPKQRGGLQLASESLGEFFADMELRFERGDHVTGLPTPWHEVNRATHGLQPSELSILAARPSMGKSIAGGQVACFNALRGKRVALFSLEMSRQQVHRRNIAALESVPHDWLLAPNPDADHWAAMHDAVKRLKGIPLYVDETADLTIGQVMARARMLQLQEPLDLIVVDHIHDFKINAKEARFEYGKVAQGLKTLAKEFKVPVLAIAQLNRNISGRSDKRPNMMDLRESGELEAKADLILFLHREDYYDQNSYLKGVVELIIAKGRDIEAGKTVHLKNDYAHMALRDWYGPLPQASISQKKSDRWGPQG